VEKSIECSKWYEKRLVQVQIPDYKQGLTVIILTSTNGRGCVAGRARFSLQVGGSASVRL
jgi:hypothetical protein